MYSAILTGAPPNESMITISLNEPDVSERQITAHINQSGGIGVTSVPCRERHHPY